MKYYSEVLDRLFDTEKQLKEEECAYMDMAKKPKHSHKDATEEKKRAQQTKNAPTKESLLNKIDEAEKELNAAQAKYKEAEKEATILSEEYLKMLNDIMQPAKKQVQVATEKKQKAMELYESIYGTDDISVDYLTDLFSTILEFLD